MSNTVATTPLTVTRAHGAGADQMVMCAIDIGHDNPAYWIGSLASPHDTALEDTGRDDGQWALAFHAWSTSPLSADAPATAQQAELARRMTDERRRNVVTDWAIEQQLPHNRVTGRSENVGAYGLQSALVGALVARPGTATQRVYVRSPRHKFTVLGVDKRLLAKKAVRKRFATRLAGYYVDNYTHPSSPVRAIWRDAAPKQDDLADAFLMGATDLLELDARAAQPRCAPLLADLRRQSQLLIAALSQPPAPRPAAAKQRKTTPGPAKQHKTTPGPAKKRAH